MKSLILSLCMIASSAFAQPMRLGGNSGGGGNLRVTDILTETELVNFLVNEVPTLARWHFNFVERIAAEKNKSRRWPTTQDSEHSERESLYRKVFLGQTKLVDVMRKTTLRLQHEPCLDPNTGEKRDAAAYISTNVICYDLVGLRNKVQTRNLRGYALALAVHEYTHLVGATEREALLAEATVTELVSIDGTMFQRVSTVYKMVLNRSQDTREMLKSVLLDFDQLSPPTLLSLTQQLEVMGAGSFGMMAALSELTSLVPWSSEQRLAILTMFIKLTILTRRLDLIVLPDSLPPNIKQHFDPGPLPDENEQGELELDEFLRALGFDVMIPLKAKSRNVARLGREAIRTELKEMLELTELFLKAD